MPNTLMSAVCFLGRAVLFVVVAVTSTISLMVLVAVFMGVASMSLAQFGILPQPPTSLQQMHGLQPLVYFLVVGLSCLGGIYIACIVVMYTYHMDKARLERDIELVGRPMVWTIETMITALLLSFLVIAVAGIAKNTGVSCEVMPEDFVVVMHEARYVLLGVLVYAGIRAADKVS